MTSSVPSGWMKMILLREEALSTLLGIFISIFLSVSWLLVLNVELFARPPQSFPICALFMIMECFAFQAQLSLVCALLVMVEYSANAPQLSPVCALFVIFEYLIP